MAKDHAVNSPISQTPETGSSGRRQKDEPCCAELRSPGHALLSNSPHRRVYLNAWIDFNRDGDWDDSGEHVVNDKLSTGASLLANFSVPADLSPGETAARIRFSSQQGLQPMGLAVDGEVEDYVVEILEAGQTIDILLSAAEGLVVEYHSDHIAFRRDDQIIAT